jgi:RNA polymerase sigma factor (sigma-70 family)
VSSPPLDNILRHIRQLVVPPGTAPESDRALVERFLQRQDEPAFAELVKRHGPMVWKTCRSVLHHQHDAEDAFQATFLVLARKAPSIRRRESIAGWLYQVAYHLALKAHAATTRREKYEGRVRDRTGADPLLDMTVRELRQVLGEELQRLPEKYRTPLVLCYLEGRTQEEAARQLGWTAGAVRGRLNRGREQLRARLARRGLTLSAGLLTTALAAEPASAGLPALLIGATTRAALAFAAGGAAAPGLVSAEVSALCEPTTPGSFATWLKLISALLAAAGVVALGAGHAAHQVPLPGRAERAARAELPPVGAAGKGLAAAGAQREPGPELKQPMTINGQVLDAAGKPLKGVQVALLGARYFSLYSEAARPRNPFAVGTWTVAGPYFPERVDGPYRKAVLVVDQTGRDGRCRFTLQPPPAGQIQTMLLIAHARGCGIGYAYVKPAGGRQKVEIRLPPEHVLPLRLVTLEGQPAVGVRVRPVQLIRKDDRGPMNFGLGGMDGLRLYLPPLHGNAFEVFERRHRGLLFLEYAGGNGVTFWPPAATTDKQGRCQLRGFGRHQAVVVRVEGEQVAPQELTLDTGDRPPREIVRTVAPARTVEGRVVFADTEKPAVNVRVTAHLPAVPRKYGPRELEPSWESVTVYTDAQGRFRLRPGHTKYDRVLLEVVPPAGVPYLALNEIELAWEKAALHRQVEIPLPRGVEVHGTVTEMTSGRPIDQAKVVCQPQGRQAGSPEERRLGPYYPVYSQSDGRFRMVVPAGPCHLLVTGPDPNFVTQVTSVGEIRSGKPGGRRRYYHGVLDLNLKPQRRSQEVAVALQSSVTLRGRVVGPDGKPIREALLFCDTDLAWFDPNFHMPYAGDSRVLRQPIVLKDGRFELPGCDPGRTYRLSFLDAPTDKPWTHWIFRDNLSIFETAGLGMFQNSRSKLGGTVAVLARKAAGKPITVRLGPCGSARVRLVDGQGKPARHYHVWLEHVFKSGPPPRRVMKQQPLTGESYVVAAPFPSSQGKEPVVTIDAAGWVSFPVLIPGVTYCLRVTTAAKPFREVVWEKEFQVESGKTRTLPDIVLPRGQ